MSAPWASLIGLLSTYVPHHLVRHFLCIFAHYAANFVIIALSSIAYEGQSTRSLGVVITAGQLNPAKGLKYRYLAVHAV
jgi:hypothetical protein